SLHTLLCTFEQTPEMAMMTLSGHQDGFGLYPEHCRLCLQSHDWKSTESTSAAHSSDAHHTRF
ncbi:MAG TPA: hypothetical protein QF508_05865, partial [Candidatus Thalassarchaeaceae archaeon]|nr:hypothetical protein [Candidatus Thalassarchaeaceae archaeon]